MDPKRLQRLVDAIATKQLPDGTWELKHDHATEFYEYIKGYVWHSAKRSDHYDVDDAAQDVIENVWKALKRYGPRYRNEPFYELFRTKVNNVLTNRYNKRISDKNILNYPEQRINNKNRKKYVPNVVSLENIMSQDLEGNVVGLKNLPTTNPIDLCEVKDQLSNIEYKKLEEFCKENANEEVSIMPQKLTIEEIMYYIRRLPNEEKGSLCIELFAMISQISPRTLKKTMAPFATLVLASNKINNKSEHSKYNKQSERVKLNTRTRIEFTDVHENAEKKEKLMSKTSKSNDYIEIGTGNIGQQFMTPFDKKIQIIGKTAKKVKILILASEEELEVPLTYMVVPVDPVVTSQEEDPVEISLRNSQKKTNVNDNDEENDFDDDEDDTPENDEDDEEEEDGEDDEDDIEEDVPDDDDDDADFGMPTPKRAEEDDMGALDADEEDEEDTAEINKPKKRRGRPPKSNKTEKSNEDKITKKAEDKVKRRTRKGTAKELVIKMLKKDDQTRDSLAQAIIDHKLTGNKSPEKVKNYVSVMLSNLKREGINLEAGKRGVYRIKD